MGDSVVDLHMGSTFQNESSKYAYSMWYKWLTLIFYKQKKTKSKIFQWHLIAMCIETITRNVGKWKRINERVEKYVNGRVEYDDWRFKRTKNNIQIVHSNSLFGLNYHQTVWLFGSPVKLKKSLQNLPR